MPYPTQVTSETIIDIAWQMISDEGVEAFSMHKLAAHFGIKTPSLYRYFKRTELLRAVNAMTTTHLFEAIAPALESTMPPADKIMNLALRYREFAHANPIVYGLLYTNTIDELRPETDESSVLPFQHLMAQLSGDEDSLSATRGLLAIMHGFVMLELAGQLRRGGNLDEAYRYSVAIFINGLSPT